MTEPLLTLRKDYRPPQPGHAEPIEGYGFVLEDSTRPGKPRMRLDYGPRNWKKYRAAVFDVVGESFHAQELQSPAFSAGSRVTLVCEDDNPYDANAVAVRSADGSIMAGHVGREDCQNVRQLLSEGCDAGVFWEWRKNGQRVSIQVLVAASGAIVFPHPAQQPWPPPLPQPRTSRGLMGRLFGKS